MKFPMIGQLASLSEGLTTTGLQTGERLDLGVSKAVLIQVLLRRQALTANSTPKPLSRTVASFKMPFEVILCAV